MASGISLGIMQWVALTKGDGAKEDGVKEDGVKEGGATDSISDLASQFQAFLPICGKVLMFCVVSVDAGR